MIKSFFYKLKLFLKKLQFLQVYLTIKKIAEIVLNQITKIGRFPSFNYLIEMKLFVTTKTIM